MLIRSIASPGKLRREILAEVFARKRLPKGGSSVWCRPSSCFNDGNPRAPDSGEEKKVFSQEKKGNSFLSSRGRG